MKTYQFARQDLLLPKKHFLITCHILNANIKLYKGVENRKRSVLEGCTNQVQIKRLSCTCHSDSHFCLHNLLIYEKCKILKIIACLF